MGVETVPGCLGEGVSGKDYCAVIPSNYLHYTYFESNLGLCQGDCDNDEDCVGDLECFQRDSGSQTPVPGCDGPGGAGRDYCYATSPTPQVRCTIYSFR